MFKTFCQFSIIGPKHSVLRVAWYIQFCHFLYIHILHDLIWIQYVKATYCGVGGPGFKSQQGMIFQDTTWYLFTRLIWLTLFMTCYVTFICHGIPIWELFEFDSFYAFCIAFRGQNIGGANRYITLNHRRLVLEPFHNTVKIIIYSYLWYFVFKKIC